MKKNFTQLDTGWMAPNGNFYQTKYMEHLAVADEIWRSLYGQDAVPPNNVDEKLVNIGWCEIHYLTFFEHGFLFHFERHLTEEQKQIIKPVFEKEKERILKSSRLDLEEEFESSGGR